ncbi:nucleotide-binding protein [Gluconobacter kondonii]|uniref:nucleotide-binding protein n=1 Tax=Gluconobacter kondonii TaxID=941463 RepID=UPI0031FEA009
MTLKSAFAELNNAILDLQQADYNTYERPLKKLAGALKAEELRAASEALSTKVDFDRFLAESNQGGSMQGSASLKWPDDKEQELGLTIALIERGAANPDWFMNFGHHWFHNGNKLISGIHKMTRAVIVPFGRDFKTFVRQSAPSMQDAPSTATDMNKIFVVHGRDNGTKETVARFLEQQGLQPVILHEQPSRGMTIPEKLIANSNVGFAVVLLTPDDVGRAKTDTEEKPRARQNVMLELGYFVGRLGRDKVCALLKDTIELPSDYFGVVYVPWDDAGAWKMELAKEMHAAGYDVDFNKVIKGR